MLYGSATLDADAVMVLHSILLISLGRKNTTIRTSYQSGYRNTIDTDYTTAVQDS